MTRIEQRYPSYIIDTDIGTDVDDTIALGVMIRSLEKIALISTASGDTALRARIVHAIMPAHYQAQRKVPIVAGCDENLRLSNSKITGMKGFEGQGYDIDPQLVVDTDWMGAYERAFTAAQPRSLIFIGMAGMTNLYRFLDKHPAQIEKLESVYFMASYDHKPTDKGADQDMWFGPSPISHNVELDEHAAGSVNTWLTNRRIPLTVIDKHVVKKHPFCLGDLKLWGQHDALAAQAYKHAVAMVDYGKNPHLYMYDPITALCALQHPYQAIHHPGVFGQGGVYQVTKLLFDPKEILRAMFVDKKIPQVYSSTPTVTQ